MFYPMMSGYNFCGGYAQATATAAENTAREARTGVELMQHDIDRLLMITEALWTLMKREHGFTDDALVNLIEQIESRKVVISGVAVKAAPLACPSCGRPNQANRSFCIYCGKPLTGGNPFAR